MLDTLLVFLPIWLVAAGVGYFQLTRTYGRRKALRQSVVTALVLAVLMIGVYGLGNASRDVLYATAVALETVVIGTEVWVLASWPGRRRLAGSIDIKLGTPSHHLGLIPAGMIAIAGLVLSGSGGTPQVYELLLSAVGLIAVPLVLLEAREGTQIAKAGLLQFSRFEPWSNIASWRWANEREGWIEFTLRNGGFHPYDLRPLLFSRSLWRLDPSRHVAATELLTRHIGPPESGARLGHASGGTASASSDSSEWESI